jgi:hypothetical protein
MGRRWRAGINARPSAGRAADRESRTQLRNDQLGLVLAAGIECSCL